MAITADSMISDILKEKANAKDILAKHAGQPVDESQLAMAMGMTLRQVAGYVGWDADKVDALVKDLNEA